MSTPAAVLPGHANAAGNTTRALVRLVVAVFFGFMAIGLPLPVVPLFVGQALHFGDVIVGTAVGIQFLATILTRGYAGQTADRDGARGVMLRGLAFCACSGVATLIAALGPWPGAMRLLILIAGRLILGFGESQIVVGMLGWGIGTVGPARSSTVLAWTGMAMYGSMAISAPIGFFVYREAGLVAVALGTIIMPLVGLGFAFGVAGVAPQPGGRQAFWRVIGSIWQPGLGNLLQGVGFATIGAFVSLDFAVKHWPGTGFAMTCFGGAFVLVRILFGRTPDRFGGAQVAMVSFAVEFLGQFMLFIAPSAAIALAGAVASGAGCSMVFPALGLEVVKQVPTQVRSTALGGFAAFQDAAYGLTGPVTGGLAAAFGYPAVFAAGAACALAGIFLTLAIAREGRRRTV